jgi:hypothetical protein
VQDALWKPTIQFFMAYYKSLRALPQLFSSPFQKENYEGEKKVKGPCVYERKR